MEKLPGMHGRGGPMGLRRGEDWVVRGTRREPFEIEAQMVEGKVYVPLETPVYTDDIMERSDPRGGVMEYVVTEVIHHKISIARNRDYAEVRVREKGHAPRTFGSVHVTISGGTNQFAIGNESAWLSQVSSPEAVELMGLLGRILTDAPATIDGEARQELTEAVEEATTVIQSTNRSPNAVKRALRGLRGLIEDLGKSVGEGTNDGVKAWAKAAVTSLGAYLAGGG